MIIRFLLLTITTGILVMMVWWIGKAVIRAYVKDRQNTPNGDDRGNYRIITDRVLEIGGPELPGGLDYRFYPEYKSITGSTFKNVVVVYFNNHYHYKVVEVNESRNAEQALRLAALACCNGVEPRYEEYEREQTVHQLIDGTYKNVLGERVAWVDDTKEK